MLIDFWMILDPSWGPKSIRNRSKIYTQNQVRKKDDFESIFQSVVKLFFRLLTQAGIQKTCKNTVFLHVFWIPALLASALHSLQILFEENVKIISKINAFWHQFSIVLGNPDFYGFGGHLGLDFQGLGGVLRGLRVVLKHLGPHLERLGLHVDCKKSLIFTIIII